MNTAAQKLYLLTTVLTPKQFTQIGYEQLLIKFTATKADELSIDHYDHHIIRANEGILLNDDKIANPQLTEKFFLETPYVFSLKTLDKKDQIISAALRDIQAYDSYFKKFNNVPLTFLFLTPTERDLPCSHDVMLRTKQADCYTYYKFIQHPYIHYTPAREFHLRSQHINSKYTSSFFLNFTYCIEDTNLPVILRNYDPITLM